MQEAGQRSKYEIGNGHMTMKESQYEHRRLGEDT